jgi:hypothetical protein
MCTWSSLSNTRNVYTRTHFKLTDIQSKFYFYQEIYLFLNVKKEICLYSGKPSKPNSLGSHCIAIIIPCNQHTYDFFTECKSSLEYRGIAYGRERRLSEPTQQLTRRLGTAINGQWKHFLVLFSVHLLNKDSICLSLVTDNCWLLRTAGCNAPDFVTDPTTSNYSTNYCT